MLKISSSRGVYYQGPSDFSILLAFNMKGELRNPISGDSSNALYKEFLFILKSEKIELLLRIEFY